MPKTTTKPKKVPLTPSEQLIFNRIIEAARIALKLPKNPRESNLVRLGEEIIKRSGGNPPNVTDALKARGLWMIAEGPRQQASRIGSEIEAKLNADNPKEKGSHTSSGNSVAAALRQHLREPEGAKLPKEVKEAIERVTIPYYLNKGRQEHPGTRELEFLFEAPFPSSTAQFGFPSEVPSSPNAFYPTQPLIERKYKNQWLFEVPFLPGADYAERIPDKVERVNITPKKKRFEGTHATAQAAILELVKRSPGVDYEKLVKEVFGKSFGPSLKLKTTNSDFSLDKDTPVEITIHNHWNSRKRLQIAEALMVKERLVLYTPFEYGETAKKQINSVGRELLQTWKKWKPKGPKPTFNITLILT